MGSPRRRRPGQGPAAALSACAAFGRFGCRLDRRTSEPAQASRPDARSSGSGWPAWAETTMVIHMSRVSLVKIAVAKGLRGFGSPVRSAHCPGARSYSSAVTRSHRRSSAVSPEQAAASLSLSTTAGPSSPQAECHAEPSSGTSRRHSRPHQTPAATARPVPRSAALPRQLCQPASRSPASGLARRRVLLIKGEVQLVELVIQLW